MPSQTMRPIDYLDELDTIFSNVAYQLGDELETLCDDEEREERLNDLDESKKNFQDFLDKLRQSLAATDKKGV